MTRLIIAGTGWPEVLDLIDDINSSCGDKFEVLGFVDDNRDNYSRELGGHPILGGFDIIRDIKNHKVINTIGRTSRVRYHSTQRLSEFGASFCNLVHPSACLNVNSIGTGNIISANTVIDRSSSIGNHNFLLRNIIVGHDSSIEDFCFMGHGVIVNGFVDIERFSFIGANSVLGPDIRIAQKTTVSPCCHIAVNTLYSSTYQARLPQIFSPTQTSSMHYWKEDS